jgi:hypothetical protein
MEKTTASGEVRFMAREEVLRIFVGGPMSETADYLPVGHLSAISRKLMEKVRQGPVGRLCPPVSPDFTLGLQAVAFGNGVLFVDAPLVAISLRHSNGRSLARKTTLGQQFMKEIGGANRLWSRTPIAAPIIPASLFNDYLELQAVLPDQLGDFPIDWVNYYVETWRFLIHQDKEGVPVADEFSAFRAALAKEVPERQELVWAAIKARVGDPDQSLRKNRFKNLRRRTGLLAIENGVKLAKRRVLGQQHVGRFKTPLDFVSWAD